MRWVRFTVRDIAYEGQGRYDERDDLLEIYAPFREDLAALRAGATIESGPAVYRLVSDAAPRDGRREEVVLRVREPHRHPVREAETIGEVLAEERREPAPFAVPSLIELAGLPGRGVPAHDKLDQEGE